MCRDVHRLRHTSPLHAYLCSRSLPGAAATTGSVSTSRASQRSPAPPAKDARTPPSRLRHPSRGGRTALHAGFCALLRAELPTSLPTCPQTRIPKGKVGRLQTGCCRVESCRPCLCGRRSRDLRPRGGSPSAAASRARHAGSGGGVSHGLPVDGIGVSAIRAWLDPWYAVPPPTHARYIVAGWHVRRSGA